MKSQPAGESCLHPAPRTVPIRGLLLLVLFFPALLFYGKLASSTALGTALVACVAIVVCSIFDPPIRFRAQAGKVIAITVAVILAHLAVAAVFTPIDFGRAFGSLFILCLCLAGSAALADLLATVAKDDLLKVARLCMGAFWLIGLLGCLGWAQIAGGDYSKSVFPFTEPSQLGITLAPILIFACVTSAGTRRLFYICSFFAFAVVLQNVTLIVTCLIATAVCIRLRYVLVLLALLIPMLLKADLGYYLDRLDFSDQNQNLSALVFVQGWQFIGEAWARTHGLGYGFQQLGTTESNSAAGQLIYALIGFDLNVFDGGFNFSKLVSEGGLLGLLLGVIYTIKAATALVFLRRVARGRRDADVLATFSASMIAGYLLEMFIRGQGYFSPAGLLLMTSIWMRQSAKAQTLRCSDAA
ncbi:hypothetical protein [Paraburkholderia caffeinilytica]|uniref:hypothetical protein n=1 Tax=Paraburkholderia caffeinilytica TaxID=1761016 RepID=UPI0038B83637